jgi:hypothetical protein
VLLRPREEAMDNWRRAAGCGRGRGSWGQRWSKGRQGAGIPGGVSPGARRRQRARRRRGEGRRCSHSTSRAGKDAEVRREEREVRRGMGEGPTRQRAWMTLQYANYSGQIWSTTSYGI